MLTTSSLEYIDNLVRQLSSEDNQWNSLAIAIDLADEIMKLILPDNSKWQEQLSRDVRHTGKLPTSLPRDTFNNQKELSWFHEHPESSSARSAFTHFYDEDSLVESKFYWFSESATKSKISVATSYSPNWEDSELTHATKYKVGIDFFLSGDTNTLLMVTSSQHKLRVLEFNGKLSNTQKQILQNNLNNAASNPDESLLTEEISPQYLVHQKIWNALQLKEVNKNFYKLIADHFNELVVSMHQQGFQSEDSKQFSSRLLGRLLFVWFLRKMDIINENMEYFNVDDQSSSDYYENHLKTLFFSTLNTEVKFRKHSDILTPYLNGGLFEAKYNDFSGKKIMFPDSFFKRLYDHFDEFNFTVDESSPDFELIAVDPEMLGQVFESLLASQIDDDGNNERNKKGAFYTPRTIVNYMVKEALRQYLYSQTTNSFHKFIDDLLDLPHAKWSAKISTSKTKVFGENTPLFIKQVKQALDDFKVLDPAVGSGAFPMGMLHLLLTTYERIEKKFDPYKLKLAIIEKNIFGVDIEPMAIEIARLRAWLSVIVDEPDKQNIQPLPNLDFKFISANSLVNLDSGQTNLFSNPNLAENLSNLRDTYFNARSSNKKKSYQEKYYQLTNEISLFDDERSKQLKSFDPFKSRNSASFFDSLFMFGVHKFDAIIGNPPYVGTKKRKSEIKKTLQKEFGFSDDLYSHFFFKGFDLLKEGGNIAYITSKTYWTIQSKKNLRDLLLSNNVNYIFDTANPFESAMVDTSIISVNKTEANSENKIVFLNGSMDLLNPTILEVTQNIYETSQNTVIFTPSSENLKIYNLYGKKIRSLHETWWDKISTSKKINQYDAEIEEYRKKLVPGDIALLGTLTKGGVGLQTGNNGKYIAVRKSTKLAHKILESRPKKLKKAIKKFNIKDTELHGYSNPDQMLNDLPEADIARVFDGIKEKYGRDVFGQGYLYRLIADNEIANVDMLTEDEKINGISSDKNYYVPYDKGDKDGNRWYLETPFAIAWSKENVAYLKSDPRARYQGYQFFFKEGFCWSDINTTFLKARAKQKSINDVKSMSLYSLTDKVPEYYVVSIINSKFMSNYVNDFINNTQTFQINDARQIPIVVPSKENLKKIHSLFLEATRLKKLTSDPNESISEQLKKVEEKLEKIILNIYGIELGTIIHK
ncbi:Eco57I restriction-modification methylase domain-containing protein [Lactiplantibacillus plantarum]|uniref:Eco57I restriction-modification methylase domain-containing protein n=3 Tax=Lactobacillaceae TaxID=33958 RepID=UPI000C167D99|nr:Eco57I restriction-modification methylase domain-containing protein [Lactiplantibacillus plantarum]PKX66158.1 type II restriction endonuclease [Lactiplantibacillus plantarum]